MGSGHETVTLLACAAQSAFSIKICAGVGLACDLTYKCGLSNMHRHCCSLELAAVSKVMPTLKVLDLDTLYNYVDFKF